MRCKILLFHNKGGKGESFPMFGRAWVNCLLEEIEMKRYLFLGVLTSLSLWGCALLSQPGPPKEVLMNVATDLVTQKFVNASCEELANMKSEPPQTEGPQAQMQAKAVEMLRNDPQTREEFINRVAGPIANKMFECELIP